MILLLNSGLCNRLRPMLSLLSIDDKTKMFWINNESCKCNPEDLFINIKWAEFPTQEYHILSHDQEKWFKTISYQNHNCPSFTEIYTNAKEFKTYNGKEINLTLPDNILVTSVFWLKHANFQSFPKIFKNIIKPEIIDTALKFINTNCISTKVIGCHIRMTDIYSMYSSQITNKLNNIVHIIKTTPSQKYFICSDDEQTERELSKYENVLIYPKKEYSQKKNKNASWKRNCDRSKQSIIDALIDLAILSCCDLDKNTHTHPQSSFLDTARKIKGWVQDGENLSIGNKRVMKVCVFTAIMCQEDKKDMKIDNPTMFPKIDGFDYILFTNIENYKERMNPTSWDVVYTDTHNDHVPPNMRFKSIYSNRYYKWNPFDVIDMDKYDICIYIDGFQTLDKRHQDIWKQLCTELIKHPTAVVIHSLHHENIPCLYTEIHRNYSAKKETKEILDKVFMKLKNDGFPQNIKPFWNGCYILALKKENSQIIRNVWRKMWITMLQITYRDQIFLRYHLWQEKIDTSQIIIEKPLYLYVAKTCGNYHHVYI